ncbi:translation initiation factor IF-2-like [Equus quagga]|uniref:translation initiation factor IF-2-like n=1 Tax=Equus quagga TaxID=89248 RepID=UPI001EE15CAE|nr:translation initiation factor IF-2-like [Equus quagga]
MTVATHLKTESQGNDRRCPAIRSWRTHAVWADFPPPGSNTEGKKEKQPKPRLGAPAQERAFPLTRPPRAGARPREGGAGGEGQFPPGKAAGSANSIEFSPQAKPSTNQKLSEAADKVPRRLCEHFPAGIPPTTTQSRGGRTVPASSPPPRPATNPGGRWPRPLPQPEQPDSKFRTRPKKPPFQKSALATCPPPQVRCRDSPGQGGRRGLGARRVQPGARVPRPSRGAENRAPASPLRPGRPGGRPHLRRRERAAGLGPGAGGAGGAGAAGALLRAGCCWPGLCGARCGPGAAAWLGVGASAARRSRPGHLCAPAAPFNRTPHPAPSPRPCRSPPGAAPRRRAGPGAAGGARRASRYPERPSRPWRAGTPSAPVPERADRSRPPAPRRPGVRAGRA